MKQPSEITTHVSAVIVSYDQPEALRRCVESLQAQVIPSWMRYSIQPEVYVGSRFGWYDESVMMLSKMRVDDHRIEGWWLVGNAGPAVARNVALRQTTADYLLFIDPAGSIESAHAVEEMAKFLNENSSVAAVAGWVGHGDSGRASAGALTPKLQLRELEVGEAPGYVAGCFSMWRREALLSIGGFDPHVRDEADTIEASLRLAEDWEFALLPDVRAALERPLRYSERSRAYITLKTRGTFGALPILFRGGGLLEAAAWPFRVVARTLNPHPTMLPAECIPPLEHPEDR
ncbi:glycosyltransferase family 2 protein [bacterium]|nr:glycosyltransferase family 2 protein [bacterium]